MSGQQALESPVLIEILLPGHRILLPVRLEALQPNGLYTGTRQGVSVPSEFFWPQYGTPSVWWQELKELKQKWNQII